MSDEFTAWDGTKGAFDETFERNQTELWRRLNQTEWDDGIRREMDETKTIIHETMPDGTRRSYVLATGEFVGECDLILDAEYLSDE